MDYIKISPDKRFKKGNIKRTGNELRGNPETLDMKLMYGTTLENKLNPPIVVTRELGKEISKFRPLINC